jgi:hypothetical protein
MFENEKLLAVNIGDAYKLGHGGRGIKDANQFSSIGSFLTTSVIPNILMISSLFLFLMIVIAGFTIVANAGDPDKQKDGAATLTWAVIGFLIVFGSYWIMQALGIITGFDIVGN